MKQILALMAGLLMLAVITVGCGSKETAEDTKTEVAEKTEMTADSLTATDMSDTTGIQTYPVRNANNPFVTIKTDFGDMTIELYRDVAPAHADSFLARTREGFYDGTLFFRVIDGFMIQGGDPKNNGTGNAGYYLNAEFSDLPHQTGTLSAARSNNPNSASSQFFLCLARNRSTQSLDNKYTVFGQVVKGFDALAKIGKVEVKPNPVNPREISRPVEDVYLRKAWVSDAEGNSI